MREKTGKKPQRTQVNYILLLGGGYVLFTAVQLFDRLAAGEAENPIVNILGGGLFALAGLGLILREWQVYRASRRQKDEEGQP